ncbi:MAG TPA: 2-C-methyl-D-erythritol 2,4-cyclodiphosphate synthase [Bacteroidota bacterium]|nr:2-C-methyl-D-erythritol 2,4-cyclodiphosphate synthase [Bacteroidota bacterium]
MKKHTGQTAVLRVGFGYDIHRMTRGRKLVLGGVKIPFQSGLLGHSDGDVLLHAICDAMLGAAALGDIGHHFPNTNPKFRNISSLKLLRAVSKLLARNDLELVNVDSTVVLELPVIAPYVDRMKKSIGLAAGIPPVRVSVKATTNEGLGAIGRGEGCAAYAVALVRSTKTFV